jgi:hypothetical protein
MFKINKLALAALVLLFASSAQAQVQLSPAQSEFSLNANATAAPQTGTAYSIPGAVNQITWTISFASAPASHTTILEVSNDNSTWVTADTSVVVAGEARNVFTAARFVRTTESARSGGGAITTTIIGKIAPIAYLPPSGILSGQILATDGTASLPGYSFVNAASTGLWRDVNAGINWSTAGISRGTLFTGGIQVNSGGTYGWSSGVVGLAAADAGFSRAAAGSIAVGNGTGGDTSGTISAANILSSTTLGFTNLAKFASPANGVMNVGAANLVIGSQIKVDALPTVNTGFGTSPSVTAGSTPFAGSVNVGTGGTATSGTILFNGTAFPSAPFCVLTTNSATGVPNVSSSTTQLVIGTSVAWPASTIVYWMCASSK